MRKGFVYIIFAAFLVNVFSQVILVTHFVMNQEEITVNFCENKDKPKLECNGKCHLAKTLTKDEENKSEKTPKQIEVLVAFMQQKIHLSEAVFEIAQGEEITNFYFLKDLLKGFQIPVEHPPSDVLISNQTLIS